MAVDRSKFRTCEQTSFCRRHRNKQPQISYTLQNIKFHNPNNQSTNTPPMDEYVRGPNAAVTADVIPDNSATAHNLAFSLYLFQNGMSRFRITDVTQTRPTYDADVLNVEELMMVGASDYTVVESFDVEEWMFEQSGLRSAGNNHAKLITYGSSDNNKQQPFGVLIQSEPSIEIHLFNLQDRSLLASVNAEQLFHFEHHRVKGDVQAARVAVEDSNDSDEDRHGGKKVVGFWEDGLAIYEDGSREEKKDHNNALATDNEDDAMWEERFHEHVDSKPKGPASIGIDVAFPKSRHLFGLPEHASSTQLKITKGEGAHYAEPYRMYNLDVFEYELDETMALYGAVPLVVSQTADATVGAFWLNPSETFVDVSNYKQGGEGLSTHWISESGVFDLFLLPGPSPRDLYAQYAVLTGRLEMPPMFALGYHQCRWNYRDEADVFAVHEKFEELDYPYDVLWLDIEHTDGKRYFTWDKHLFPNPIPMQDRLAKQGRKMVTIVDPHIKRDNKYRIHSEATKKGLYIKDKTGKKDYDGWCWPGSSSYLDFTDASVRQWWAEQFAFNKYIGSTKNLYTWNDMNEPSVFNGPEVSMQKDLLNLAGVEHREWHNLYGQFQHRATAEGLVLRHPSKNERPFVLSRSFFAGSQKYGAIWTGDNESHWSHLQIAAPMLLSLNVGGLSFVGADVGGFFGNPDAELMTRWIQAGAYQPFFRGHAHHDSKRREPWVFGEETMKILRHATAARYALLPYWYTVFHEARETGMPVMRTMWMEYPKEEALFGLDNQWMIGSDLLVKPVTTQTGGKTTLLDVRFPRSSKLWYDVDTLQVASPEGEDNVEWVTCPMDKIPVYQRGGSIIARKLRLRRSTELMVNDPYTLYIALDEHGNAEGSLYSDDQHTFDYKSGKYTMSKFVMSGNSLYHESISQEKWNNSEGEIERIVIMGMDYVPAEVSVVISGGEPLKVAYMYEGASKVLVIRKPGVSTSADWSIALSQ
uniref:Glucosidase II subunit alpha n=2 Tax=Leptocylindrus danicus TaxID=163516 RepID=A0A7S2PTL2_9STRA|eukprot:CAMPEP_0116009258 /NCGR_PEP_ID=MMETSP0321-20121206/3331_1 /TAXON_ID=163516 /ORGANISM="Leptocylindrus danicus var. danicus, Strain B650" /LENGTH=979 /DNA_ID=CAMNT_0003478197 /DNA_START=114 /DNA_END=3053 /DNA_ORIENTATION=+